MLFGDYALVVLGMAVAATCLALVLFVVSNSES